MNKTGLASLPKRVGKNVAKWRKERDLTQQTLADRLDMDTISLSRIERGATTPSLRTLEKIAVTLTVRVIDLLGEHGFLPGENETNIVMAYIAQLNEEDRSFVIKNVKLWCEHFIRKD